MKAATLHPIESPIPYAHNVQDVMKHLKPDSPVYLFHADTLLQQSRRFQQHFSGLVTYAVKANPHPLVLHTLGQSGIQAFDVASLHEVQLIHQHVPHAQMHFNNPIKTPEVIRAAYEDYGVRSFALDDEFELSKLVKVCKAPQLTELTVRFALTLDNDAYDLSSKFGATKEQAIQLLKQVADLGFKPSLTFHVGSQCTNPQAYDSYIQAAADIAQQARVALHRLNVGGGFPAVYTHKNLPSLETYFATIDKALAKAFPDKEKQPTLVCESGRAMVADCCHLLTKVLHRRQSQALFLNDGVYGGFMEQLMFKLTLPTTTWHDGQKRETVKEDFTLFGPTCDSVDKFSHVSLPHDIEVGDYIEFACMGAYGSTTSTHFNGFSSEQYVMVDTFH